MRVLIATTGSTGDVAPYTGLGRALKDSGHEVTVATHAAFEPMIRNSGLRFRPLAGDPRDHVPSPRWRLARTDGVRGHLAAVRSFVPTLPAVADDLLAAARQGTDAMLLGGTSVLTGKAVADALGIPNAGVLLQPHTPTRQWPAMFFGRHSFGPGGNLVAGKALFAVALAVTARVAAQVRGELGLPAQRLRRRFADLHRWPVWYGFSPEVVARPDEWPDCHRITGYWWPHPNPDWKPAPALEDFLAAGPPPVYIGFGSMAPARAERIATTALTALRRVGVRGIVHTGWAGLNAIDDDVITIDDTCHHWLFPRTAAVVHHAGAGTTAAGLRAGVPAVPVPVFHDQTFWADRLRSLGVSPTTLPLAGLTADRLTSAIRQAVHHPHHRYRARQIAARLAEEDSAKRALVALEDLTRTY